MLENIRNVIAGLAIDRLWRNLSGHIPSCSRHVRHDAIAITSSALDIIQSSYYIHGPLGDENIFAVLYVSLCYGPHRLL